MDALTVVGCSSVGGELLTSTYSIVQRWKEYIEDPFNLITLQEGGRAGGLWAELSHPVVEVAMVVKQLCSVSTPGLDEINPQSSSLWML